LQEHKIDPESIRDLEAFSARCPTLNKQSTFGNSSIRELAVPGTIEQAAHVLPSSGYGGSFSFGIETRHRISGARAFVDTALDTAFQIKSKRTLAINCLPMGVSISSDCMAIATVSVREDIAVGVIEELGAQYDQVLLLCDPLFFPCLLAHASTRGVEWHHFNTKVILGGEVFGENLRSYAGRRLGYSAEEINEGHIRSSMGVAELGLHLLYETAATIGVSRASAGHPKLAQAVLGTTTAVRPHPMLLTYDADRVFLEIDSPDAAGFGLLTVTLLDPGAPVPLVRYQPGDVAAVVDAPQVVAAARAHGITAELPLRLIALRGRRDDILPSGSHVSVYREALFSDQALAAATTGAYRAEGAHHGVTLHVQLVPGLNPGPSMEQAIHDALAGPDCPVSVRLWTNETFPFGRRLDYERKFRYRG